MNKQKNDAIDIAERGIEPQSPEESESTLHGTCPSPLPDDNYLTGRTGSARLKQKAMEFRFFPACEPQLFMALDYLSAKLWKLQEELERLERVNREANREDYMEHQPDNEYGKRKEVLMDKLIKLVKTYFKIFHNANGVLSQPSPDVQYVDGYKRWINCHLSDDPTDKQPAADNYRFLGPRPSSIDASFHSFLEFVSTFWPFQRRKPEKRLSNKRDEEGLEGKEEDEEEADGGIIVVEHSNTLFRGFSHTVMILFAFVFLLLPPTLVSLVNMSELQTVLFMVSFCLAFFLVVIFLFGRLGTEHKFLLFFAYASAMVTMLASINRDVSIVSIPGLGIPGVTDT